MLCALVACGESTEPTVDSVAGSYTATAFTVTEGGSTTDVLADGGSITLTLNTGGSAAGRLFVPGGAEDGSDFDEDLTGTWTLTGTAVSLDHAADTFLRDMTFTVSADRLTGQETFAEATIAVTLAK
jgi:hypothetical protein